MNLKLRSSARLLMLALLPLLLISCAAGSIVPDRESMPAARASLLPEYRIFYDSMQDYGDWVLIEPYGYVFRPHVNFVAWKPYEDGFWAPTDVYGWTWISSEPFGWATYHYGNWTYDDFQGWVWVPGADWGPAWVTWNASNDYVGWAPQPPSGPGYGNVPGGAYNYVPVSQLGSMNLASKVVTPEQMGAATAELKPLVNTAQVEGVRINRGPPFEWVERKTGPLTRVSIQDLVRPGDLASLKDRSPGGSGGPRDRSGSGVSRPAGGNGRPVISADSTRHAAENAAQDARTIRDRGFVGPRVSLVRPFGVGLRRAGNSAPKERFAPRPRPGGATRDTTRSK